MRVTLVVLAKAPAPGRSKTRLCPPCSPGEAARLAAAALEDTFRAVERADVDGPRMLALEGEAGAWVPDGWAVAPQRGFGLDERLAAAFVDAGGPALLVGMDTPQLSPELLATSVDALLRPGVSAVLGPALDGGYWAIGLREPDPGVFLGVPMSVGRTCARQRARLHRFGLATAELPALRDVDTMEDAEAVAADAPETRFAAELGRIRGAWEPRRELLATSVAGGGSR